MEIQGFIERAVARGITESLDLFKLAKMAGYLDRPVAEIISELKKQKP